MVTCATKLVNYRAMAISIEERRRRCGQPVDLFVQRTSVVTDPVTGMTAQHREAISFCPRAFHFVMPERED